MSHNNKVIAVRMFSAFRNVKVMYRPVTAGLICLFFCFPLYAEQRVEINNVESGLSANRILEHQKSNEFIDPVTGELTLSYVDLFIPGNGGMDIKIQRYNKGSGLASNTWQMHLGRIDAGPDKVFECQASPGETAGINSYTPERRMAFTLTLADGSVKKFVQPSIALQSANTSLISKDNWRANCLPENSGLVVDSPNGVKYTFGGKEKASWILNKIEDLNNNSLIITYAATTGLMETITRNDGVTVTFESKLSQDGHNEYNKMMSGDRTVTYHWWRGRRNGYKDEGRWLDSVVRPDGSKYLYEYEPYQSGTAGMASIKQVIDPMGGRTVYTYKAQQAGIKYGGVLYSAEANYYSVIGKHVYRDGEALKALEIDYWSYRDQPFSLNGVPIDRTFVASPNRCIKYYFVSLNLIRNNTENYWQVGNLLQKDTYASSCEGPIIESTKYEWEKRKFTDRRGPGSNTSFSSLTNHIYYTAQLKKKTITRDGADYVTIYSERDKYGQPTKVIETGQGTKTTRNVYQNDTDKWLIGQLKQQTNSNPLNATDQAVTDYSYDAKGQLLRQSHYRTDSSQGSHLLYTYDAQGNVSSTTDANGNVSQFGPYSRGIALVEVQPGAVTVSREVDFYGNIINETDARGNKTRFSYDALNRVTQITPPAGHQPTSINWQYKASGGATKNTIRGPLVNRDEYDSRGNLVQSVTANVVNDIRYDAMDRPVFYSQNYFSDTPATTLGVTLVYDSLNRLVRKIDALGAVQRWQHLANNKVQYSDKKGQKTTYSYLSYSLPSKGAVIKIEAPENQTTLIDYNILGQQTQVSQGRFNRQYRYNNRHHLQQIQLSELDQVISFRRDLAGNLLSKSIGNTLLFNNSYDARQRLTAIDYQDINGQSGKDVQLSYDKNDNLVQASKGEYQWRYQYDKQNNLLKETLAKGDREFAFTYQYNGNDQLSSMLYPSGQHISYNPNVLGLPQQVGSFATSISYFANGAVKKLIYGNGISQAYTQDQRQLPSSLAVSKNTGNLVKLNYSFDDNANLVNVVDGVNATQNRRLQYDSLDRLQTAAGNWGNFSYHYDNLGNITSRVGSGEQHQYRYDDKNKLTVLSGGLNANYTYGPLGETIGNGEHQFRYDSAENLVSVDSGNIRYEYDVHNRRVAVIKEAKTDRSVYSLSGSLLLVQKDNGNTTEYIYANGNMIAQTNISMDVGEQVINRIYQAFFKRQPESNSVLQYWSQRLQSNSFAYIVKGIGLSSEAISLNPTSTDFVNAAFLAVMARSVESPEALSYWVDTVNRLGRPQALEAILSSTEGRILNNREYLLEKCNKANQCAAPVVNLRLSSASIYRGSSVTASWSTNGSHQCVFDGKAANSNGQRALSPTKTTNYLFSCAGSGGISIASVKVIVNQPPKPLLHISLSPARVLANSITTATWSADYASSCELEGARVAVSGKMRIKGVRSKSYTLSCKGAGGSSDKSISLTVMHPAPTLSLNLSPNNVYAGSPAKIMWAATHATRCQFNGPSVGISGISVGISGSHTVVSSRSRNYSLTCNGLGGSITKSAYLVVTAKPLAHKTILTSYYQHLLGRAPDTSGLTYWSNQLRGSGCHATTLGNILRGFTLNGEFTRQIQRYPVGQQNRERIRRLYSAVLQHGPDAAGWNYWTTQLNNNALSFQQLVTILLGTAEFTGNASRWCRQ